MFTIHLTHEINVTNHIKQCNSLEQKCKHEFKVGIGWLLKLLAANRCFHAEELFGNALIQSLLTHFFCLFLASLRVYMTAKFSLWTLRSNNLNILQLFIHVSFVTAIGILLTNTHLNFFTESEISIQVVECVLLSVASWLIFNLLKKIILERDLISHFAK